MAKKFKSGSTYSSSEKSRAAANARIEANNKAIRDRLKVTTLSKSEVAALNKKLGPKIKRGVRGRITQQDRALRTETGWERDTKEEHAKERQRERRKPSGSKRLTAAQKSDASNTAGEKQKARTGRVSDARTRVGGGSPGSRVAGGLARARGR